MHVLNGEGSEKKTEGDGLMELEEMENTVRRKGVKLESGGGRRRE